jgi:hypothetical protein
MDVCMKSCELVSLVTAATCAIADCVPFEDIPMIAAVLGQIAATLTTITVQEGLKRRNENLPEGTPDTEPLLDIPNRT